MSPEDFIRMQNIFENWYQAKSDLHCCGASIMEWNSYKNAKKDYEALKLELIWCERCFQNVCECNI